MNLKKRTLGGIKVAVVLALLCGLSTIGLAQETVLPEQNPAYLNINEAFDFSVAKPVVNINLPKFLLDNMLSQMDSGPDDPFAKTGINISELTKDIQLLHIGGSSKVRARKIEEFNEFEVDADRKCP